MNYPTAGNLGPIGQGLNHAAPPSAGRAHPSQHGEPSLGLGLSPLRPVAPKPRSSHQRSVGPPGLPHRLLFGTRSHQISSAYLGGILVWRLSYALLLRGGGGVLWPKFVFYLQQCNQNIYNEGQRHIVHTDLTTEM